eukprot:Protomagalhaensia_wolfi_Nauph_80__5769@NODE_707_length_2087_cov_36_180176_g529_i0_p3_GENE_NODE_707_length_2087_cov_36_180176_g529_i0NODE_707_length_2087_cov_36_180176_g529_i0_p3_ORF_typecomplete_len144_score14_84_NODE_707_length_2087_cov_36_180176_g529_i014291860
MKTTQPPKSCPSCLYWDYNSHGCALRAKQPDHSTLKFRYLDALSLIDGHINPLWIPMHELVVRELFPFSTQLKVKQGCFTAVLILQANLGDQVEQLRERYGNEGDSSEFSFEGFRVLTGLSQIDGDFVTCTESLLLAGRDCCH